MSLGSDIDLQLAEMRVPSHFEAIEARIDSIAMQGGVTAALAVGELLTLGETVLETWIEARGQIPTRDAREGFRLLALQRQGARGEPSFNACRETCRELVYHHNLIVDDTAHADVARRVRLAAMVAKHLCLFVEGKMQVEGLGEFCCAAKPMRSSDT
jgi:hypothetical protein